MAATRARRLVPGAPVGDRNIIFSNPTQTKILFSRTCRLLGTYPVPAVSNRRSCHETTVYYTSLAQKLRLNCRYWRQFSSSHTDYRKHKQLTRRSLGGLLSSSSPVSREKQQTPRSTLPNLFNARFRFSMPDKTTISSSSSESTTAFVNEDTTNLASYEQKTTRANQSCIRSRPKESKEIEEEEEAIGETENSDDNDSDNYLPGSSRPSTPPQPKLSLARTRDRYRMIRAYRFTPEGDFTQV